MGSQPTIEPDGRRKTVFIAVHQGFAARYLLRTAVLRTLKAAGARIVILTPNAGEPYMQEEFADEQVSLEPLRGDVASTKWRPALTLPGLEWKKGLPKGYQLWWLIYNLRHYALPGLSDSAPFRQKYFHFERKYLVKKPRRAGVLRRLIRLMWRSRRLRRSLLAIECRLYTPDLHGELFERYRPDLVVTSGPGWFINDAIVLREARRHRVPSVAVVLSWDNPTTKGYRGADPDHVVAWSGRMVEQLVRHQDLRRDRIVVGGVPHFDHYASSSELPGREQLFGELGLDPDRRLILYATSTPGAYGHNVMVAQTLARAIEEDRLGAPAQLVVRLHPIHFRVDREPRLEAYERLVEQYPNVRLDLPEILSDSLRCDMPASDGERLGALLARCDVLVNVFSTTSLEAFLLDRPVATVSPTAHLSEGSANDAGEASAAPYRAWQEFAHLEELVGSGAARIAQSMPELVDVVRAYLADPSLDREQRLHVARRECGPTDGRSGERIGNYLLELMGVATGSGAPDCSPSAGAEPARSLARAR